MAAKAVRLDSCMALGNTSKTLGASDTAPLKCRGSPWVMQGSVSARDPAPAFRHEEGPNATIRELPTAGTKT